jgi:dTMP kinase
MKKYKLTKGILIAIEGIDGAGKTTQVHQLKDYYNRKGFPVSNFREPTRGQYGQKIRELAINGREKSVEEEFELFLKDREEDCNLNIRPALMRNEIVIMDRYYFSSIAYQGALGLDIEYIKKENEKIAIIPDLVIILDCAVKIGLSRITDFRNDIPNHFEQEHLLERSREIFNSMHGSNIQIIDSSRNENQVFEHLQNIVLNITAPYTVEENIQRDLFDSFSKKEGRYYVE